MFATNLDYGPIFADREPELEQLSALLATANARKPQVVLVSGDAGTGKTRLVQEFLNGVQLEYHGAVSANGNCSEIGELAEPCLPFIEILLQLASQAKNVKIMNTVTGVVEFLEQVAPDWLGLVPAFGPALKAFLKTTAAIMRSVAEPGTEDKLHRQFEGVLLGISDQRQPILLFVDDLQWADKMTAAFLMNLIQKIQPSNNLSHLPMLLLVAYRRGEVHDQPANGNPFLAKFLREARRYNAALIDLNLSLGKDREYLLQLVSDLLQERYGEHRIGVDVSERLIKLASGNCLLLNLLLSYLEQEGGIVNRKGVWRVSSDLDNLLATIPTHGLDSQLGALTELVLQPLRNDPDAIEVLKAASVQGMQFYLRVVANVLDKDLPTMDRVMRKLVRLQLVEPVRSTRSMSRSFEEYSFRYDLLRKRMYEELMPLHKRSLHEKTGLEIEKGKFPLWPGRLGEHFLEGECFDKALEYYYKAAQQLSRIGDWQQLDKITESALQIVEWLENQKEKLEHRSRFLKHRSYVWDATGQWQLAIKELETACSEYCESRHLLLAVPLAVRLGALYMRGGRNYSRAEKWLLWAKQELRREKEKLSVDDRETEFMELLEVESELIRLYRVTGKLDQAIGNGDPYVKYCEAWECQAPELQYRLLFLFYRLAWSCEWRSGYDVSSRDFKRAMEFYKCAIAISEKLEASLVRGYCLALEAFLQALAGEHNHAVQQAQEAVELSSDSFDPRRQAFAIRQLGTVLLATGAFDQALNRLEEALDIQRRIGDKPGIAHTLIFMAVLKQKIGDDIGSQADRDEAWRLIEETNHFGMRVVVESFGLRPSNSRGPE